MSFDFYDHAHGVHLSSFIRDIIQNNFYKSMAGEEEPDEDTMREYRQRIIGELIRVVLTSGAKTKLLPCWGEDEPGEIEPEVFIRAVVSYQRPEDNDATVIEID